MRKTVLTEIELPPADHFSDVRFTYDGTGSFLCIEWNGTEPIDHGFMAELVKDADYNEVWVVHVDNQRLGYFAPEKLDEAGGWIHVLDDGATILGYDYHYTEMVK